jgi:putative CRISPR-associated protein (TIGR02620 family)
MAPSTQHGGTMFYLLTRHEGTLEWLKQQLGSQHPFVHIQHLDDAHALQAGDHVLGNLPLDRVAKLNALGIRYSHVVIHVPFHLRGTELTAANLAAHGAHLQEFRVLTLSASPLAQLLEE